MNSFLSFLRAAVAVVCVAAAPSVFGAFSSDAVPEKTYANVLTLDVTSDSTLEDALSAAGATISDLTGNVYDKIVKKGVGKVTVATDLSAFTGDLFLENGVWCITANNGWGAASVPENNTSIIVITSDATLEIGGTTKMKGLNKSIYVAGTGCQGAGAIRFSNTMSPESSTSAAAGESCGPFGRNIVLTGDAKFVKSSNITIKIGINRQAQLVTFYLHDRKLVFEGTSEETISSAYWATGGTVEIAAGVFNLGATAGLYSAFEGNASSEFILSGTGTLKVGGGSGKVVSPWTLVFRTAAPLTWVSSPVEGADYDAAYWSGPARLETDAVLTGKNGTSFSIKGKVSGAHSLTWQSITDGKTPHLFLGSTANDFTGGMTLDKSILHAAGNGSIPSAGGTLSLTNAAIDLIGQSNCSLPPLSLVGACSVVSAAVQVVNRPATPGLYEGYDDQIETKAEAVGDTTTFYTDSVQLSPRWANLQTTIATHDTSHFGRWTYSGYLWNNTSAPVVWIFSASPRYRGLLRVADAWVNTQSGTGSDGTSLLVSSGKRGLIRATLQPGANRIEFIGMMTATGDMKTGSIGLDDYDKTTLGFGKNDALMVYKQDVTLDVAKDVAKVDGWEKFEDPGDGSVFTIDLPSAPEPQQATVPSLAFGAEATLELAGWNLVTTNMTGFGTLANAHATNETSVLTVEGVWTVDAAAVRAGEKLVTDRAVAFGSESSVVLSGTENPRVGRAYVILQAAGGITGLPTCPKSNVTLSLSEDGRSLILVRRATGVVPSLR